MDVQIRTYGSVKCLAKTHYPTSKFLKSPNTEDLLDALLDLIPCRNESKYIMLSMHWKEKQKAWEEKQK